MWNVATYEETKDFEVYLLIKHRILDEYRDHVQTLLLQQLEHTYVSGGTNYALMDILTQSPRA